MQKVVIVIPIHKANPTKNELASFEQCYKILGSYPIRIVVPEGLNTDAYTQVVKGGEFLFVDKTWLNSIEQYNKLKISLYFYNLFKEYEYLLTYELDAWVFRDELLYWCEKGYDYIGAPWFEAKINPISEKIVDGGNSGFSLRSIQKSIKILKRISRIRKYRRIWFDTKLQSQIPFIEVPFVHRFFRIARTDFINDLIFNWNAENEDYIWSYFIKNTFTDYRVAPIEEAIKFSFEVRPSYLYKLNGNRQPFGCHAWEKYDPKFWEGKITIE